eukprot:6898450-Alexandrium_andersonii.AAC.1
MSASLVGSEMCIRDRSSRACAGRSQGQNGSGPTPGCSSRCRTTWGCAAVSYTHLTLPTICSV